MSRELRRILDYYAENKTELFTEIVKGAYKKRQEALRR